MSQALAAALPDIARWLETRGMLLSGRALLLGGSVDPGFVVLNPETGLAPVVGRPDRNAILEAASGARELLAFEENLDLVAALLEGWSFERAALHTLPSPGHLPVPAGVPVRFLTAAEIDRLEGLPPDSHNELRCVAGWTPVAAALDGGIPVSFAYAAWETESLWDVSIETRPGYRNRGMATAAVSWLIRRMFERGKLPVWGALESNTASLRLARKLAFEAVDHLYVFERPAVSQGGGPPPLPGNRHASKPVPAEQEKGR